MEKRERVSRKKASGLFIAQGVEGRNELLSESAFLE
jgi:hypothetical protein